MKVFGRGDIYSNCIFNGNTILHSTSVTAYQTETVSYGNTCVTQQRLCTNGTLSGTYTYPTCSVAGATGTFNLSQTTVTQGTPVTITNNCTTPPTSYSSSNTSVATVAGNIITTIGSGTTDITPTNGACGNNVAKTLTVIPTFLTNCTANGQIYYADSNGVKLASVTNAGIATWILGKSMTDLTCAGHIVVCSGNNTGYTIKACNAGATTVGVTSASYGNRYQFGKSDTSRVNSNNSRSWDWKVSGGTNGGSANDWGVLDAVRLTATWSNSDLASRTKMQGPCLTNYHVPTNAEWIAINTAGLWGQNSLNLSNTLKLPYAGWRYYVDGTMGYQDDTGLYWSSSPSVVYGNSLAFNSAIINTSNISNRSFGFSVRCIKN